MNTGEKQSRRVGTMHIRWMIRRDMPEVLEIVKTPADKTNCDVFYAADDAFWKDVWYWQTPEAKCVDGRTDATCKDFDAWVKAWTEIKG